MLNSTISRCVLSVALAVTAQSAIANANYNEINDLLSPEQALGRFEWLNKCYDGVLVELWELSHDATQVLPKEQKIQQLRDLWQSQAKIDAGRVNYPTFANSDFSNPYEWYAGTHVDQACTLMPPEYKAVALMNTVLANAYCENVSYDSEWEWIASVKVGDFVHESGSKNFTLVSGKVVPLQKNQQVDVQVVPGNKDTEWPSYVAMRTWVDWDQNGLFSADELVKSMAGDTPFTFNLKVPAEAASGLTRMRIATDAGGGFNNACSRNHYGEVEDYLINIR